TPLIARRSIPSIPSTTNRARCFSGSHSSTDGGRRNPVWRSIVRKLFIGATFAAIENHRTDSIPNDSYPVKSDRLLVLLCHIFLRRDGPAIGALQHGHRGRLLTSAPISRRRMVAIEFGMGRSGRSGGSSGSVTVGYGKFREQRGGTRSTGGNRLPLGDQESVGCDEQRGVMMEAAPPTPFKMSEPELLLELLIVPFDTPAQLGGVDQPAEGDLFRKGREPVFGRLILALGPLDQQPLFRSGLSEIVIAMRDPNAHASKPRGQPLGRAFPPFDRAPCALAQSESKFLDRDQLMLAVAAHQLRWSPAARPSFRRQRRRAQWPDRGVRSRAGDVAQSQRRDIRTQIGLGAIAGIHQNYTARKAGLTRPAQLLERDFWLGLEANLFRHIRLAPTFAILSPVLRQIQPIGHRQTCMVIGNRQRHRDLAIVLLAKLAAILPRYPDRVPPLLGKAGVVDDPGFNRPVTLDLRQHHLAHLGQHPLVRPRRVADEMQQGLMLRRTPRRRRHRRHRLQAPALARQHQANAIVPQRPSTVSMANHAHKPLDIPRKSRFTVVCRSEIHINPHLLMSESLPLPESGRASRATF